MSGHKCLTESFLTEMAFLFRNNAQLFQHSQRIPDGMFRNHLAVCALIDTVAFDVDGFAGGRNPLKISVVRACCRPAQNRAIFIRQFLVNRKQQIRERCQERLHDGANAFDTGGHAGGWIVPHGIGDPTIKPVGVESGQPDVY